MAADGAAIAAGGAAVAADGAAVAAGGAAVAAGTVAAAAGSVARRLLLQKRGPTSSLWRQVLAWLVVRPSQCCGKFQHF